LLVDSVKTEKQVTIEGEEKKKNRISETLPALNPRGRGEKKRGKGVKKTPPKEGGKRSSTFIL